MEDIIEWELKDAGPPGIVLALTSAEDYNEANWELVRYLVDKRGEPGVYVTLNKPYTTIKKVFEDIVDLRMLIFIDAITKPSGRNVENTSECLFLEDLNSLSDLALIIDEAIEAVPYDRKFLFFDNLSTLLLYNNTGSVAKFAHFLTSKMRMWGLDGVFLSLELESDEEFLSQLSLFCDKVVHLEKEEG